MKIGDEVYVHGYVDEIRNDCVIIRNDGGYFGTVEDEVICFKAKFHKEYIEPKVVIEPTDEDAPQTDTEIARTIVHKMIDDAVIAEDAYPDLRQKMHDAVDEYEPQTEDTCEGRVNETDCPWK